MAAPAYDEFYFTNASYSTLPGRLVPFYYCTGEPGYPFSLVL
jgi:hypothetical protein